jgi:hypothetical protein
MNWKVKGMTGKRALLGLCLLVCIYFVVQHLAAVKVGDPAFSIVPIPDTSKLSEEITINVTANRITDVFGYEVNVDFDTSRLVFSKATSMIPGVSIVPIVKEGRLQFASTKTGKDGGESGDLVLCSLTFRTIAPGKAAFSLASIKLVNSQITQTVYTPKARTYVKISGKE